MENFFDRILVFVYGSLFWISKSTSRIIGSRTEKIRSYIWDHNFRPSSWMNLHPLFPNNNILSFGLFLCHLSFILGCHGIHYLLCILCNLKLLVIISWCSKWHGHTWKREKGKREMYGVILAMYMYVVILEMKHTFWYIFGNFVD